MKRLTLPNIRYDDVLDKIVAGITGIPDLSNKVRQQSEGILSANQEYKALGRAGELYTVPAVIGDGNTDVVGTLKKQDFLKLYENYFVKKSKPARCVYDKLMVAANDHCPFCGGIGRPRNLDHYLPKALFPQFSVSPENLIPACRDCNMDGKADAFARVAGDQVLHPYLDNEKFYNEQWISATCSIDFDHIGVIEYKVTPPGHWSDDDKSRVKTHFESFDIAKVYSREAATRITTFATQIRQLLELGITEDEAKSIILIPAIDNAPFINHWERLMCLALYEYPLI
ncbi:HNH endonuclease [Alteromonas gracilis]|uniref:HNH endonuclease n=1 Tax=Alteromonas gracilis TaxID=1479524 RepID=UPI0030CC3E9C